MASSSTTAGEEIGDDFMGDVSGWVEAYTECPHLHHLNGVTQSLPQFDSLCSVDLSVWCFECDHYLDAQVISQLRPIFEALHLMKFGDPAPPRAELRSGDPMTLELS